MHRISILLYTLSPFYYIPFPPILHSVFLGGRGAAFLHPIGRARRSLGSKKPPCGAACFCRVPLYDLESIPSFVFHGIHRLIRPAV